MTADADFKRLVRERMAQTGSTYTQARAELLARLPDVSAPAVALDPSLPSQRTIVAAPADDPRSEDDRLAADRAFYDRTVRSFFDQDRLNAIPSRRRPRVVVLLELLRRFEPGREYAEREVNDLLAAAHEDFAFLRRELVNYGYLTRTGSDYRIPDALPYRDANESQEVPVDEAERALGRSHSSSASSITMLRL